MALPCDVEYSVDKLAEARTPAALIDAHDAVKAALRVARKRAKEKFGPLAQTYVAAMKIWDQQKADGVPQNERLAGLEKTLRAAWPFTREWHYVCDRCKDAGLVMGKCDGTAICGREKQHLPHTFGWPCTCQIGSKFRPKPKMQQEDFQQAGKSKPMSRMGR